MRTKLRIMLLTAAFAWLVASPRGQVARASDNCECDIMLDGWKYVLADPHCGSSFYTISTTANSEAACANYCVSNASAAQSQMCGHLCDQEESPENGGVATATSWDTCWYYPGGGVGCYGGFGVCGG